MSPRSCHTSKVKLNPSSLFLGPSKSLLWAVQHALWGFSSQLSLLISRMLTFYINRRLQSFHSSLSFLCRTLYIVWKTILLGREHFYLSKDLDLFSSLLFQLPGKVVAVGRSSSARFPWPGLASCLSVSSHVNLRCFLHKNKADSLPTKLGCLNRVCR